jgi:hypothetical protein
MIVQAVGGIRVVVTLKDQRLIWNAMARDHPDDQDGVHREPTTRPPPS